MSDQSGSPPIALRTGRITALLDGADLRYVTIDGVEVARRIYVTVRDADWGTPPVVALANERETAADTIRVRITATQRSGAVEVDWRALATLSGDGRMRFEVAVTPSRELAFNRIGLCLLHPPDTSADRPYRARGPAGTSSGALPRLIAPQRIEHGELQPLFPAFTDLRIDVHGLGWCAFGFEGDEFEMEDQRNWSDGSFKTYCTPLHRPRPRTAQAGDAIEQALTLAAPQRRGAGAAARRGVELAVGEPSGLAFPELGLALGEPLTDAAAQAIRALAPGHLRVELRRPDRFAAALAQAEADAARAGAPVVLALHLGESPREELVALARALEAAELTVACVLAFSRVQPASDGALVALARELLAARCPGAAFGGGTDAWFVDLNRGGFDAAGMDAVAWSITPAVHGDDELTMIEALDAQLDQAQTARTFAGAVDLRTGPISLQPRYNPNAADAAEQALAYPPASIDPRQGSRFAAAWTAGSIRAQALGGVRAATYYETAGPRGVVPSGASALTPCGELLAAATRWHGWEVLSTSSSAPLRAHALLVRAPGGALDGFVVNLAPERQRVRLDLEGGRELELAAWEVARVAGD